MRRRDFITLVGGAAAWPVVARAQKTDSMRRIGVLIGGAESDGETRSRVAGFRNGLQALGWTEGRNIKIDYRFTSSDPARIQADAAELVRLAPDVMLTSPGQVALLLHKATRTIPIIFANVPDPVGIGLVASLPRPGGNVTGFTSTEAEVAGKWLEVLKEAAPSVTQVAVIYSPPNPAWQGRLRAIEAVAPALNVKVTPVGIRDAGEIDRAIQGLGDISSCGVILLPAVFTIAHREAFIALAARHRLPAVYPIRVFVSNGGLISYGHDVIDQFRRAASYVDRILKGEKPADLPVQAADRFELVINLKTAKALGLTIPPMLLGRADEVIE